MQRFFSILADAVTRFEGTVDKFTGDGIMAVFGAPIAHEDHARRACYAALQMLEDVAGYAAELRRGPGLNFSTRIGINSGEVVAGAIGAGAEGDYTAIGHTVGLAQRMEALAEPGKAYLTEHAAALAGGYLDLEDLGEFEIKGASQPVRVFELAGVGAARSRLDLARARGFSRFVGRSEEMGALEAALERAEAGDGRAVGLVADPGVGKSRLCHEFCQRCRERGLEVFEAQAQSHGQAVPFMPVLQMLRSFFGIGEREPEQLAREKIAGRALLLDPGFAEDLPLLFDFLGVPDPDRPLPQMSPEARQRALGGIVCRLANAPSRRKTLVLVIEDLHWIDEGSAEMLGELVESIEGTNTLAVVNYRPEYAPPWAEAASLPRRSRWRRWRVPTPRELLRDLAGEDPSLDGLDEPIHERTQGNPFFIEEIVRELGESGHLEGERGAYRLVAPIEDAGVPVTVQAILAARIDRLTPDAKQLLQVASVVGKELSAEALGLTAELEPEEIDGALASLIEAGFLYEAELYPQRLLAFRHPLTREVAYGTQLAERRAATHAAAARATIELEPDRLDELAGLVAHHLDEGGEALEAARWFARAAHWAGHSQPRDALRLWQRVTELADGLEPRRRDDGAVAALADAAARIRLAAGDGPGAGRSALADGGDRDRRALRRPQLAGAAEAADLGPARRRRARRRLGRRRRGSVALADESGDPNLRVAIRGASRLRPHVRRRPRPPGSDRGRDARADRRGPRARRRNRDRQPASLGADGEIGRPARARPTRGGRSDARRGAAQSPPNATTRRPRAGRLGSKTAVLADRGEIEAALALALRNCELTERLGDVFSHSMALTALAYVQIEAGEFEAALEAVERADRGYREAMGDRRRDRGLAGDPARPGPARPRADRGGAEPGRMGGRHRARGAASTGSCRRRC